MLLVALALFTRASIEPPALPSGRHAARSVAAVPDLRLRADARAPALAADNTHPRLRPLDAEGRGIVSAGETGSATVAQLVEALEGMDVVVYVQTALNVGTRGRLSFIAYGAPLTYVLVRIDLAQGPRERLAALAHELTHAVEIAEARPPVRSEVDLAALYHHIGRAGDGARDFESPRAVANERQTRLELTRTAPPATTTHED